MQAHQVDEIEAEMERSERRAGWNDNDAMFGHQSYARFGPSERRGAMYCRPVVADG